MKSLIISLPSSSPLLFLFLAHPFIHKYQPIRHALSYVRSLFIGIDVPLPPVKQATITTQKHQHKLHLSYTDRDNHFLQRTQQLCTKIGLPCNVLEFNKSTSTSTSTLTPTSATTPTSNKHVIDLELLPDEWEDEFLQPLPLGTPESPPKSSHPHQLKKQSHHKKHVKIKTSRNITYHIPRVENKSHTKTPLPKHPTISSANSSQFVTTPTITFSEWEKIPVYEHHKLPYTFCIQCEKPIQHKYWYDHMQTHKHKTPTSTTTLSTTPQNTIIQTSAPSTTTKKSKKPTTYTCPYDGCHHKFNPNTKNFVRDLNAHIDSYHDDIYTYTY